jgi:molecular chaperone GrpE
MRKKNENSQTISELAEQSQESPVEQEPSSLTLDEVKAALAAKSDEVQALQDKYLRLAAEFENYKKLSQRDLRESSRFANESILKEFLPIIDNLERAVRSAKENPGGESLIRGVELTLKQFSETLAKFGVRPVVSVGTLFDPSCHQAVARLESAEVPENQVIEEFQKGYRLHDRTLRAAMVSVATAPAGGPDTATPNGTGDAG